MKRLTLSLLSTCFLLNVNCQSFITADYKLGITSLSSNYESFYTGIGLNMYFNVDNNSLLSVGLIFGSNTINSDIEFDTYLSNKEEIEEDEDEYKYKFLANFLLNVGSVQVPIKVGKLVFNQSETIGFMGNVGFVTEILLSKNFYYPDYSFRMKNPLGVGVTADANLLFRVEDYGYFITSISYHRLLTKYSDIYSGESFTKWGLSVNLGFVLRF